MTVAAICYEGELAAACLAEYKPDLVFLTIEMPRLSGLAIAEAIQRGDGPKPDLVFVTGGTRFRVPYAEADGPGLFSQARDRRGSGAGCPKVQGPAHKKRIFSERRFFCG